MFHNYQTFPSANDLYRITEYCTDQNYGRRNVKNLKYKQIHFSIISEYSRQLYL